MIKVGHQLSDENIACKYSEIAASLGMPTYFYKAVAHFVGSRPQGKVLDLGCGNGDLLSELIPVLLNMDLIGVEISLGRLCLARDRLNNRVSLIQIGAKDNHLPFADQSMDLVCVTEVIEHLKDPISFLREINRVLSPRGRLILTTPNSDAFPFWEQIARIWTIFPRLKFLWHFLPFEHPLKTIQPIDTVLSIGEVESIIQQAYLSPIRVCGTESFPFLYSMPGVRGLVYRKILSRTLFDGLFNTLKMQHLCYRTFWECKRG
ncbi:class I SAM-dependent methyltransferase [Chloroflexales bacterium ZM16-3]|nr:class I SAM-dependent methyltransferase [Chloroflexales bacterium ZM16-3]